MSAIVLDLTNLPPAERNARINEAVAVHCAGLTVSFGQVIDVDADEFGNPVSSNDRPIPGFAESADAVLPLLYARPEAYCELQKFVAPCPIAWRCCIGAPGAWVGIGDCRDSNNPAWAVALALLRASGVKVVGL